MKDYKENLKRIIEVSKIGCCPGCGLTLEGLEQIISERDKELLERIKNEVPCCGYCPEIARLILNTK